MVCTHFWRDLKKKINQNPNTLNGIYFFIDGHSNWLYKPHRMRMIENDRKRCRRFRKKKVYVWIMVRNGPQKIYEIVYMLRGWRAIRMWIVARQVTTLRVFAFFIKQIQSMILYHSIHIRTGDTCLSSHMQKIKRIKKKTHTSHLTQKLNK